MEFKENSKKVFTNYCNVVVAGRTIEATQTNNLFKSPVCKKIAKDKWLNIESGELIEKDNIYSKNKCSNIKSVKQTVKRIRNLINSNFFGMSDNEYFITLTYKENMTDSKKLYKDFDKFIKKLKYDNKDLLYIGVVEPQARGAWHVHLLLKNVNNIDNDYISSKWNLGYTYLTVLNNVDNVGAYLSAYLTNTSDKKGARLYLYPQNMNIFRCSRNCKRPFKEKLHYTKFFEKYNNLRLKYVRSYDLYNGLQKINSVIFKSYLVGD